MGTDEEVLAELQAPDPMMFSVDVVLFEVRLALEASFSAALQPTSRLDRLPNWSMEHAATNI